MAEEEFVSQGDQPPEQLFTLPAEALDKIQQLNSTRQPMIQQVPVNFDSTPISMVTEPEVVLTKSGPMIVRRRLTKTKLYRADGQEREIAISQRQRLLNKRGAKGEVQWFTNPPVKLPANTNVCRYCFKKFRPSTQQEISANAAKAQLDEETLRLLREQYPGMQDNLSASINDVTFKLAEHIRVRHGRIAAFTKDPLFTRIQGAQEQVEPQVVSTFNPDAVKRGRGRPRKVV